MGRMEVRDRLCAGLRRHDRDRLGTITAAAMAGRVGEDDAEHGGVGRELLDAEIGDENRAAIYGARRSRTQPPCSRR